MRGALPVHRLFAMDDRCLPTLLALPDSQSAQPTASRLPSRSSVSLQLSPKVLFLAKTRSQPNAWKLTRDINRFCTNVNSQFARAHLFAWNHCTPEENVMKSSRLLLLGL